MIKVFKWISFITVIITTLILPIIFFETSAQAQIVIPMAVSLSFGVLFATIVTLIFIPSLYVIIEDLRGVFKRKKNKSQHRIETTQVKELPTS